VFRAIELPMRKRLLLIAFHFPPVQGSTGVHRSLAFSRYLGRHGWDVTVLTATPSAYPRQSLDNNALVPQNVRVVRALALDAQRHFSLLGRYPRALATPDRWRSWIYSGLRAGRRIVREWSPHAIFSTYPIASAHEIALRLSRICGLPWVADFRDPMGQDAYPTDDRIRGAYWALEQRVLNQCAAVTVTTEGTAALYRDRYPAFPAGQVRVIANGFDEMAFPPLPPATNERPPGPVRFLHSGNLYPHERNPEFFFRAVAELRAAGKLGPDIARFDLRGGGFSDRYHPQLASLGIEDMVRLLPGLPYREALREMHESDYLMLFQAANCNRQIPAKLYEYLYVSRPIIGFTDRTGDTGRLLTDLGIETVAALDDTSEIKSLIMKAVRSAGENSTFVPARADVMRFSRAGTTETLAALLDDVIERGTPPVRQGVLPR
jgi:glycosyltransferase involved in cell wall biosynthesis